MIMIIVVIRLAIPSFFMVNRTKEAPGDEGSEGKSEGEGEGIRRAKRVINIGKQ